MHIDEIQEYCLSFPEVEECTPFGPVNLVYKVNGKIFAILSLDQEHPSINVKCNPDKAIELREEHEFILPGFHMNKKHWNTIVVFPHVSKELVQSCIDHSYSLVAKVKKRSR